jgi:plasmid stability protein
MRTLTIKNIPDELYEQLKQSADLNRRSINSEVIVLIERAVGSAPFSPEATLERARRLREKTAGYTISDEALTQAKQAGRP